MKNMKTFEEFHLFGRKKELTPDEEYQKQKRKSEKSAKKLKDEYTKQISDQRSKVDPYSEENWNEKDEIEQIKRDEIKYKKMDSKSSRIKF